MAGLPLPLGSESQKIHERFCVIFEECIENNMSKDDILRHIQNKYLIPHEHTNRVWNHLESTKPDLFIAYNARIRDRNPQASPQEANAVYPTSQAGPSRASNANANAIENQNLQTSLQQQPVIPNDFCQQVLNALSQIIKILSDGRGRENEEGEKLQENESGGNEEAEKQVTEKEEGKDEEAEKPQEKEEGDNEGLQKKDEGDNEGLQKNERADS